MSAHPGTLTLNGWTLTYRYTPDGTWWAEKENEEPYAATSYLEAAAWALMNPPAEDES